MAVGETRLPAYTAAMQPNLMIETLRAHEPELRRRGVRHAALFGSCARGTATAASDIDVLLDLDPDAPIGVFEYAELTDFIANLLRAGDDGMRVDVANRAKLKALVRPAAEREAVYAF